MYVGPDLINEDLVFGYDTGYGIANNSTATRFYPGEPTTNLQSGNQTTGIIAAVQAVSVTYVGQENGWSKYSLNGTWTSGTYPYSMRVATQAFTGGTKYSTQLLIKTNVESKFVYFATTGFNYVNEPLQYGGVNSSTILDDGSRLLQRQGFGYVSSTSQPGYLLTRPVSGAVFSSATDFVWVKNFQIEQKDNCTPHTLTSRSSTEGLLDLTSTFDIDLSNMSFNSTAQPEFDGTDDIVTTSFPQTTIPNVTIEAVVYRNQATGRYEAIVQNNNASDDALYVNPSGVLMFWPCGSSSLTVPTGQWSHVAVSYNGTTLTYTVNGTIQVVTATCSDITDWDFLRIGGHGTTDGERWIGKIAVARVYEKSLSAAELTQNYNAYKNRFNL